MAFVFCLMQNRFQIINVWRLLSSNPIKDTPLAIYHYRLFDLDNDIHVSEVRESQNNVWVRVWVCSNSIIHPNTQPPHTLLVVCKHSQ
jgi:hypothetical protein